MFQVGVTTTADTAATRLGRSLEDHGLVPVLLPCIRVEAVAPDEIATLRAAAESADWIVITSRRAVQIVWPDADMPDGPSVAAVGATTAEEVARAGGRPVIVGGGGAAALRAELEARLEGCSVVFPHGRAADPATARWLEVRAADLVAGPVYDTIPIAPAQDPVDAVVFGSPSAVDGWRQSRSLTGLVLAVMGTTTATHLESLGYPPDVVPETPGADQLAWTLAAHLASTERSAS